MQPQIVKGKWIMVDGDNGITYIPAEYISEKHVAELIQLLEDNGTIDLHHAEAENFLKNTYDLDDQED
jgi:hypothetical protein